MGWFRVLIDVKLKENLMEILMEFMGKGLITMLIIAMPCVLTAAAIGLVVGIIQAVTQVQEQTIAAAPKIFGVFLVILILGTGYVRLLTSLVQEGFQLAFNQIPSQDNYVLPQNYHKYTSPFASEMKDSRFNNSQDIGDIMRNPGKIPFIDNKEKIKNYPADRAPNPRPNLIETNKILGR